MTSNKRFKPATLLMCAVLLSGCGGSDETSPALPPSQPPSSAMSISVTLEPDKAYDVGDIQNGWLMRVPKGALGDQPTTLEMRTATDAELTALGVPLDSRILSLSANGQHNVRLQELVEIAAQIPPKLKQASPWELMYGYHTANGWEYWPFKEVDMAAGVAVIEAQHFSWFLQPVQPSTAERLTVYSRTMAAEYTQKELARQALAQKLGPDLDKTLAGLGITDRAVVKNLSTNMLAYLESAHIDYTLTANAALSPLDSIARIATGNEDERKEKSLEIIAKALHWSLAKGGPGKWQASGIGALGSLGTAVGALAGGDSEAAGNATYSVLKGLLSTAAPGTGLVFMVGEAAVGSVQNAVDAFTASELEKAYQVYAGHSSGKGYYETGSGNIEALLAEMAGGGRQQEIRILDNYCAKRIISPCELDQREREYALDKGRESLKAYFVQRKANEEIYKTFELQEKEFVAELEKDQYLLVDGFYKAYFGDDELTFDIEGRLQRIYRVRDALREIFDGPNAAKMTHRDMVLAIRFWMTNKVNKTVPKFYEWAIEQGYTSSSFKPDVVLPTPPPAPVPPVPVIKVDGDYKAYLTATAGIKTTAILCDNGIEKEMLLTLSNGNLSGSVTSWPAAYSNNVRGVVTGNTFSGAFTRNDVTIAGSIGPRTLSRYIGEGTWEDREAKCSGTFRLEGI
jgi:hypothetical protein